VIKDGTDMETDESKALTALFLEAEKDVTSSLVEKKKQAILRRSWRIHDDIVKPFKDEKASVAKFALIIFYVLDKLREQGFFHLVEGSPLDVAIEAILHPDGTVVEYANIKKIDDSARKAAAKVLAQLQANDLYAGASW
jgi:hypothetical protein